MVRTLKVSMKRKTFLVRLEGESGGKWCSLTEHSRGSVFALGFEKEEVGWLIEHLTKAIELKRREGQGLGATKKRVVFNSGGPLIEYRRKGKAVQGGKFYPQTCGSLYRSFTNVVREEGPRRGGLLPIGRWARTMMCECPTYFVNWVEVGCALAKKIRAKRCGDYRPLLSPVEKVVAKGKFGSRGEVQRRMDRITGDCPFIYGESENFNEGTGSSPSFDRGVRWGMGVHNFSCSGRR
ncbi:hypothetical protein CK203_019698 [Vitis vinifera]|uniref:Uncharacterized protein n=1 Tax=Vitis vinifera TaxID=29760 RepID=A0A438JQY4_VITVI|nr:hypothetical protein CK203_019698 [Vitis vinifera]